ncbi:MAG: hypothetical protein AMXMBFR48_24660 [Ignavibacteriales bacterium]
MPSNLEIKISVPAFADLLERMQRCDCRFTATIIQKDIYYRNDKGLLKLRVQDKGNELIFYNRDEVSSQRKSDYHILYVNNQAEEYFARIFTVDVTVEKTRQLYMYKNTRIHLDTVKGLGEFLELEAVVTTSVEQAQEEFDFLFNRLHLQNYQSIRKSYSNLLKEKTS